ncbi:3-carboxy-cis,cis-muconate cycloisomerase [Corynebacterium uropygiale]|uniref:3-carboxy-cis,cis-muconate cycloisomerase n=1 Tax=Corynebacterium uropygiale TaxID=1775911 RepID=A0A9X1U143_9CORY|nr:lyase family protein [Corynebacterium uropygiale]MCF4007489.1 3-carboxy-cis,cis-muconate cycloisomerase [Corynebacterium uropygiale]
MSRSLYADLAGGDTRVHEHLSDEAFLRGILRFEAALAEAAGSLGVVSAESARHAVEVIAGFELDCAEVSTAAAAGANPAIPLAKELKAAAGAESAGIHTGATSQDAIDSSLMLALSAASSRLCEDLLHPTLELLRALAEEHRETPMMGRTLGQQATPTTFGLCAALWWQQLHAAEAEIAALRFPVQYAGATGTLAAVYPHGIELHAELARRLGLASSPLVWHTDRSAILRIGAAYAQVAGAVAKIATDIIRLCATEVAELSEPSPGGSSAMPHKANPAASVAARGYALRAPGLLSTLALTLGGAHQRAEGEWHAEWQTLRELAACTASALARCHAALDGLVVHAEQMATNRRTSPAGEQSTGHAADIVTVILGENS